MRGQSKGLVHSSAPLGSISKDVLRLVLQLSSHKMITTFEGEQ